VQHNRHFVAGCSRVRVLGLRAEALPVKRSIGSAARPIAMRPDLRRSPLSGRDHDDLPPPRSLPELHMALVLAAFARSGAGVMPRRRRERA
jgi:hypothetical protein